MPSPEAAPLPRVQPRTQPLSQRRIRRRWVVAVLILAVLTWDVTRRPERQVSARIAIATIRLYQATLSPWIGKAGVACRFDPTCSHYGEEVFQRHGALRGSYLTARRIVRCGPWTAAGTNDPPP